MKRFKFRKYSFDIVPTGLVGHHVGQLPPPFGGVTLHCSRVVDILERGGMATGVITLTGPRSVKGLSSLARGICRLLGTWFSGVPIWIHFSSLGLLRATQLALVVAILRSRQVILVPHSGEFDQLVQGSGVVGYLIRKIVRRASEVYCFNSNFVSVVKQVSPKVRATHTSSFVPTPEMRNLRECRLEVPGLVVTSGYRNEVYGYLELIRACDVLKEVNPETELKMFVYGPAGGDYWETVVEAARSRSYISIEEDCTASEFLSSLSSASVYVRNTSHDSYGVASVEALYLGCVSLAADSCGRPPGVVTYKYRCRESLVKALSEVPRTGRCAEPLGSFEAVNGADAYVGTLARHGEENFAK